MKRNLPQIGNPLDNITTTKRRQYWMEQMRSSGEERVVFFSIMLRLDGRLNAELEYMFYTNMFSARLKRESTMVRAHHHHHKHYTRKLCLRYHSVPLGTIHFLYTGRSAIIFFIYKDLISFVSLYGLRNFHPSLHTVT